MKAKFLLLLLMSSVMLTAQDEKSLFWEISGNGLAKKSYVYGTMHVSDKVSFHLSDAFFTHLLEADMVANESDPETWSEIVDLMDVNQISSPYRFYSHFYMFPLEKEDCNSLFINNNYFSNMLSGIEDEQTADFQENTVLDMFIYQTGRKYNKKTVGLESARESILSLLSIDPSDARPKDENRQLLSKLLKNRNYNEALKEFYREKDITMLDSIYKLLFSKKAHDLLIVNRNIIMTQSIDSLARTGSLFSAVGAAHLSGKMGILHLLKQKGYTVRPVIDVMTEVGQRKKKAIETSFPNPGFVSTSSHDGMLKMPLNKKTILTMGEIGSPDFTNGGVINIKRLPLNNFLRQSGEAFDPKSLDSLFFENIPGDILEKKLLRGANFTAYDIRNKTKIGNTQHYRFYVTPLEIIAVSMTGSGNYVNQYEKQVFDEIKIAPSSDKWERVAPQNGGFTVDVPSFKAVYGNETARQNNMLIQAYKQQGDSYFFLIENTLPDVENLEDTEYEHRQLHHEFLSKHKTDTLHTSLSGLQSLESESLLNKKKVFLKSIINGSKYYLLGAVNASEEDKAKFFSSFIIQPAKNTVVYETLRDTLGNFTVKIPRAQNERLFLNLDHNTRRPDEDFRPRHKSYSFYSETGSHVEVQHRQLHRYAPQRSLDSIAAEFRRRVVFNKVDELSQENEWEIRNPSGRPRFVKESYRDTFVNNWYELLEEEEAKYEISSEQVQDDPQTKTRSIDFMVTRSGSLQAKKYKLLLRKDSYYLLQVIVPKDYNKNDAFIETVFSSFTPLQPVQTDDDADALSRFINDVSSGKDSLRNSAFRALSNFTPEKGDAERIIKFLKSFNFKETERGYTERLIDELSSLSDAAIIPFLEEFYLKKSTKTSTQLAILRALANQRTKAAYKKILELMKHDLPIAANRGDVQRLFDTFSDDYNNSSILFPEILKYLTIEEYTDPVIEFSKMLFEKKSATLKKLGTNKNFIISRAKTAQKRAETWKENDVDEVDSYSEDEEVVEVIGEAGYSSEPVNELLIYLNFLYYLPTDKDAEAFIEQARQLEIPAVTHDLLRLDLINGNVRKEALAKALNDVSIRYSTIQLLLNTNNGALMQHITDDDVARAAVVEFRNLNTDSKLDLIEKKIVRRGTKNIVYYFFTTTSKSDSDQEQVRLYPVAFFMTNNRIDPLAYRMLENTIYNEEAFGKISSTMIQQSLNEANQRASFGEDEETEEYYGEY